MGREIRRVPSDWQHPPAQKYVPSKDPFGESKWVEADYYQPLYDKDYETVAEKWISEFDQWRAGTHPDQSDDCRYFWEYDTPPDEEHYRERKWTAEEATHYQIYETVTEGTPVSPVFASLDELVEWCVAQGYSRHAAENFAKQRWVPSMAVDTRLGIIAEGIEVAGMYPDEQAE
jgi:hypothetical protein